VLDGAAYIVRLAFDVWPSYGGSFVLVSMVVEMFFVPLTIRSAGTVQKLAALQPQIQRIQTAHAGDPAVRNAVTRELYRSHDVALGAGCFLIILRLAVLGVLFMLVQGLVTLDPNNGGGPRYVEQGTALWRSLKGSGGNLPSFGIDLGKTLFTQGTGIGIFNYLMLLVILVALSKLGTSVSVGHPAGHWVGILVVTFIIALIFPGAVVLYLAVTAFSTGLTVLTADQGGLRNRWQSWWQRPHREFQARSAEADRLDAVRSLDAAATLRLSATTEFSRKAGADRLVEYAHGIQRNLVVAAARQPSGAVAALAELDRNCPQCVSRDMASSVIREWARSSRLDRFGDDWATIETLLAGKSQDSLEVLLDACRSVSRDELTETFRRGVTTYLWSHLDRNLQLAPPAGGQGLDDHGSAFQLLDVVGPRDLFRAGQLCALGDLALARAVPHEARGRYEAAFERGSMQAAERLAYHQAREGHRLLSAGSIPSARRTFAEAWRLHKDPEYVLLDAIAGLLSDDANTRVVLDQLEALDRTGVPLPYITFWRAIAHLRRGEQGQAIALLRGLGRWQSDSYQSWGPIEEGAVLLAVLENDDHGLVHWARRLVRVYGEQWLAAGPTDPWPLVSAVTRHDRDLLAEMVALVGNPRELPEWVRTAGAYALLTKSMESARAGQVGAAAGEAELAQRLLSG